MNDMKKNILNIIAVSALLLSLSIPAESTTYYVSPIGNDFNQGTITSPWHTFQKALTIADAGDTVYFRGGNYTIESPFGESSSGIDFSKVIAEM